MKKNISFFIAFTWLLNFQLIAQTQKPNTLTKQEKKEGWKLLFDGKTTKGWHKYGGSPIGAAWKVADGNLYLDTTVKNAGGDITTKDEFESFDLKLEWK